MTKLRLGFSLSTWVGAVQRIVAELRKPDFVTTDDLKTRLLESAYDVIYPIGNPIPTFDTVVPDSTVFIMLEGQTVAVSDYPRLFAKYQYRFGGSGTTFTLPNLQGRTLLGKTAAGTGSTVGGTVGSAGPDFSYSVPAHYHGKGTLAIGSSGSHTTTLDHDHAQFESSVGSAHTHTINHDHGSFVATSSNNKIAFNTGGARGITAAVPDNAARVEDNPASTVSTTIDVPNFTGTSGVESSHTHHIDVPAFAGNSSSTGAHTHANGDFTGSVGATSGVDGDVAISGTATLPCMVVNYYTRF